MALPMLPGGIMTVDRDTLFKVLDGRQAINGGSYRYKLRQWTAPIENVEPCQSGYHLARGPQVITWLGPDLFIAEADTDYEIIDHGDKVVCGRVRIVEHLTRWNDSTARLFAADCAEAALLGERASGREPNGRSWAVIEVARRFAEGEATLDELAAAGDAAWDAWSAAWSAAARDAAGAAWAAAWDAGNAAWDAGAAARNAGNGAWNAGNGAWYAGNGAWYAGNGDGAVMFDRLCLYLNGEPLPPVEPLYGVK